MFRLGLIGGGRMGRTHLRALANSSKVTVTAIAETHAPAAAELRTAGHTVFDSVDELLTSGLIDGILIAAPSPQHLELVQAVAAAGLPILCEKPCGVLPEHARAAQASAAQAGVLLQVAYWRRFVPELARLRQQIVSGELGTLHFLACTQWDGEPPAAQFRTTSGGIFIDMGVHELDQARWLTGSEVVSLVGYAHPRTQDPAATADVDSAQALLHMADGSSVLVSLGRYFPGGDMVVAEAFGVAGHQQISVIDPTDGEAAQLRALQLQAEAFARAAQGGSPEGASGHDAWAALDLAAQLTASAQLPTQGQ
jgi:myo-inositol 2-dehydrogenase/D-chiro-inositol 1-dehydrogenase